MIWSAYCSTASLSPECCKVTYCFTRSFTEFSSFLKFTCMIDKVNFAYLAHTWIWQKKVKQKWMWNQFSPGTCPGPCRPSGPAGWSRSPPGTGSTALQLPGPDVQKLIKNKRSSWKQHQRIQNVTAWLQIEEDWIPEKSLCQSEHSCMRTTLMRSIIDQTTKLSKKFHTAKYQKHSKINFFKEILQILCMNMKN